MYAESIRTRILERLAEGESLRSICSDDEMPRRETVYEWLKSDAEFSNNFARARELGCHALADECLEIADDARNDWMERKGVEVMNPEAAQRSRLRIDTRLRLLGKWLPAVYGDKQQVEHTGSVTIQATRTDEDL